MVDLISTFGIGTVLIVLLISIPCIIGFISWCKSLWAKREVFRQENIQKGKEIEALDEKKEARLVNGEARMSQLESDVVDLQTLLAEQQKLIKLLIKSDELEIKSWIKMQHEKWIPRQCIDSQTLDLLCQRYEVYAEEGGNSWAEKLVDELKELPVVTIVPIQDIHQDSSH